MSHLIDPFFERAPASLDDLSSLESMKEQAQERRTYEPIGQGNRASSQISSTIENLQAVLIATLLYGVLLSPPSFDPSSRRRSVELAIVSRWGDMTSIKSELSKVLETSYFLVERTRRRFATPLMHSVKVASLKQPLDIQLSYNQCSHSISGFLISVSDMTGLQGPKPLSMDPNQAHPNSKSHLPAEAERTSSSLKRPRRTHYRAGVIPLTTVAPRGAKKSHHDLSIPAHHSKKGAIMSWSDRLEEGTR